MAGWLNLILGQTKEQTPHDQDVSRGSSRYTPDEVDGALPALGPALLLGVLLLTAEDGKPL